MTKQPQPGKGAKPAKGRRVPSAERKPLIAKAAAKLFAEKGFHGARLRELAHAAGVSEALIIKYFPTKEDLLRAALEACRKTSVVDTIQRMIAAPPSTAALVRSIREFAEGVTVIKPSPDQEDRDTINRMLLRSLAEDGEFARLMMKDVDQNAVAFTKACLDAAQKSGDLVAGAPVDTYALSWLRGHLSLAIMAFQLPQDPPVDYRISRKRFIETLVRFELLGFGLKPAVIERHLATPL
jgi:AcrR family transcriptional regulator